MDLQGLIADQFGYFGPADLPGVLLSMVFAGLSGAVIAWAMRMDGAGGRNALVLAVVLALGAALTKGSLPLSVILGAVVVAGALVGPVLPQERAWSRLVVMVAGFGCGIGASVIVCVALVPLVPLLRWASSKQQ